MKFTLPIALIGTFLLLALTESQAQTRDTLVYRYIYRDTVIYRYDTVYVKHYIHSDTVWKENKPPVTTETKRKGWYNPNSWGIGPMLGAYYSPYHGFDLNIGFGIQYYLFAIPSFRNPHMGSRKKSKN